MATKRPKPEDLKKLAQTEEFARIEAARPTRKQLAEELGPFKTCTTPTYVEEIGKRGKLETQVNITDEKATPEENRRRWSTYVEAASRAHGLETARSQRISSEKGEITFHDVRTGEVRSTSPEREEHIAKKSWARPGRSRRVYIGFGRAKS